MTREELLPTITQRCETFRTGLNQSAATLSEFLRRMELILTQLHRELDVRDTEFSAEFNQFCLDLRAQIDQEETFWNDARQQVRALKPKELDSSLALSAKGFNSKAKILSRSCDEFSTLYHLFYKTYQSYTAHKLNVWLLTSCDNDVMNITGKILFLAREITKQTERNRENYVR